jgi:UDP-N-acetyl-D-galactosamine dehydrogenase
MLILGVTFKENCPDIRNTKVVDIYHTLEEYTNDLTVYDPWANADHVKHEYGIETTNEQPQGLFDAVILAVAHQEFLQMDVRSMVKDQGVIYDVKGVLSRDIVDGRL